MNMGRKFGGSAPFWGRGAGSTSNTKSPGPRPTSIPSGISIHATVWPQQIWADRLRQTRLKIMALQVCSRANILADRNCYLLWQPWRSNGRAIMFYSRDLLWPPCVADADIIFWPDSKPEGRLFSAEFVWVCRPISVVAKRLHGSRCHLVWR